MSWTDIANIILTVGQTAYQAREQRKAQEEAQRANLIGRLTVEGQAPQLVSGAQMISDEPIMGSDVSQILASLQYDPNAGFSQGGGGEAPEIPPELLAALMAEQQGPQFAATGGPVGKPDDTYYFTVEDIQGMMQEPDPMMQAVGAGLMQQMPPGGGMVPATPGQIQMMANGGQPLYRNEGGKTNIMTTDPRDVGPDYDEIVMLNSSEDGDELVEGVDYFNIGGQFFWPWELQAAIPEGFQNAKKTSNFLESLPEKPSIKELLRLKNLATSGQLQMMSNEGIPRARLNDRERDLLDRLKEGDNLSSEELNQITRFVDDRIEEVPIRRQEGGITAVKKFNPLYREDGGISDERLSDIFNRSPYGTGVPMDIGYDKESALTPTDAAAIITSGVPVVGDILGLVADADMYARDPESRNILNYVLSVASMLPIIPAASLLNKRDTSTMVPDDPEEYLQGLLQEEQASELEGLLSEVPFSGKLSKREFDKRLRRHEQYLEDLEKTTGLTRQQRLDRDYPVSVYHGTNSADEIDNFDPSLYANKGTFLTESPALAFSYGNSVMPLRINDSGFAVVDFRGNNWNNPPEDATLRLPDGTEIFLKDSNVFNTDDIASLAEKLNIPGIRLKNIVDIGSDSNLKGPDFREELIEYGENLEKYDQFIVMDSSRIRSTSAKADPKRKSSENILAAIAPVGVGLGGSAYLVSSRSPITNEDET
jgi:hypothetical protein